MFKTPEIASTVTLLPVDLLGVDAAILFADILTLPAAMGFNIQFPDGKGPQILNPVRTTSDIEKIHAPDDLSHIEQTIKIVNRALKADTPLIGFAGGPFSVCAYLVRSKNSFSLADLITFAYLFPKDFHKLMRTLTQYTIQYLKLQQKAGIKAFQLFDTWAGQLRREDYEELVLPYVQEIFKSVSVPTIYYLKNCAHLFDLMEKSGADMLSVCETVTLGQNPSVNKTKKGIQGNLFNGIFWLNDTTIQQETTKILKAAQKYHKKYIFNLSHGILPATNVDKAKLVIKQVKAFSWTKLKRP